MMMFVTTFKSAARLGFSVGVLFLTYGETRADMSRSGEDLATLQQEIESLKSEMERQRTSSMARLEVLSLRKTELEIEVGKAKAQLSEQREYLAKQQVNLRRAMDMTRSLAPVLLETCNSLRGYVESSLPFKKEERLSEVQRVCDGAEGNPSRTLPRLWALVEDEMRLTHENGLFRQVVRVDGGESLADVARIGMTMMFFQSADARVGNAEFINGRWRFVSIQDRGQITLVQKLFDSFRKGVKVGAFALPNRISQIPRDNSSHGGAR